MRTRHPIACGLAALALIAAGCGDDKDSDGKAKASSGDQSAETQESAAPEPTESAKKGTTTPPKDTPKIEIPAGDPPKELVVEDVVAGQGAALGTGMEATVNYVGVSWSTKKEFDSSYDAQPITLPIGAGQVIPGWDEGLLGMRVGGRRKLVIPPDMGYGAAGQPPVIKPNETLVFIVDLIDVK